MGTAEERVRWWTSVLQWATVAQGLFWAVACFPLFGASALAIVLATALAVLPMAATVLMLKKGWLAAGSVLATVVGLLQLPIGLVAIIASVRVWSAGEETWIREVVARRSIA